MGISASSLLDEAKSSYVKGNQRVNARVRRGGARGPRLCPRRDGFFLFCVFFPHYPFSQLPVIICCGDRAFLPLLYKIWGKNTMMNLAEHP